jgi:glycerol-3-phosphate dehydrogenase (NAD(P)+)
MDIAVIGAGSWGTVLSQILSDNGHEVILWARTPEKALDMESSRCNKDYLPDFRLSSSIKVTNDLGNTVKRASVLVFVVPSKGMEKVAADVSQFTDGRGKILLSCTKGFSPTHKELMTSVLQRYLPEADAIAALSGPNLAVEIAKKQPAATVIACKNLDKARELQVLFMNSYFRPYVSDDLTGVQLCGCVKNCYALITGLISGLGYGENSQAALITRGLAEVSRLGRKMGARPETFSGLAGIGDLVATCSSPLSRNRTAGTQLAKGKTVEEIIAGTKMVIEGIATTKTVYELAHSMNVEMPIIDQLYEVLYHHKEIPLAARDLMNRAAKSEWN